MGSISKVRTVSVHKQEENSFKNQKRLSFFYINSEITREHNFQVTKTTANSVPKDAFSNCYLVN